MSSFARSTGKHTNHTLTPEAGLWILAGLGAGVDLAVPSPITHAVILWLAFVIAVRIRVVTRRRNRRAAHRATREALMLANSAHDRREVEAVAA